MDSSLMLLEQYQLIEVVGVDAEKFLQGQLTCDVNKMQVGEQSLCAHCDPKGKVSALFRLFRLDLERFVLAVRNEIQPEALLQLKKYAVFSKVEFNDLNWQLYGNTMPINEADFSFLLPDGRYLGFLIQPQVVTNTNSSNWDLLDIKAGIPILTAKARNEFLPQTLNLQCLERAISFQKGCYIGQEMVARAKYRGANKRAMYCFCNENTALPEMGSEIEMQLEQNWRNTGTVLYAMQAEGKIWLQVILSNQLEAETKFALNGHILRLQPSPYAIS